MQEKVKEFNKNNNRTPMPIYARLLDISSEIGELFKEYLKPTEYGSTNFEMSEDFKLEYGDVLYSLLSLANELEINAEECLDKVLKKYQERINKSNSLSSENN